MLAMSRPRFGSLLPEDKGQKDKDHKQRRVGQSTDAFQTFQGHSEPKMVHFP